MNDSVFGERHTVTSILDAVESWGAGFHMIRETGAALSGSDRSDAVLIPVNAEAACMKGRGRMQDGRWTWWWDRVCLVGVEVKLTREDFRRGIREGQFEKYQERFGGLYLAIPHGIALRKEVPEGVGLLTVRSPGASAVCVRNPVWRSVELDSVTAWRLVWRMHEQAKQLERTIRSEIWRRKETGRPARKEI